MDEPLISPGAAAAPAVDWLNANLHETFALIAAVLDAGLSALEAALLFLPPAALIAAATIAALFGLGRRPAMAAAGCLGFALVSGLWEASMQTIALVATSVFIAVLIAFPLGILAARRPGAEAALRPLLDIMQTVPPWVYLIPAVMVFSLGRVPAIIATVVYGIPPMLRLTTLAFKQVPRPMRELGEAAGAAPLTMLMKIEIPAAKPTLLVGLNQCILLSLAMAVLAGLVGAGGLGAEVTRGLTRMEMGLGLRAGLAIVAVALLLDRLSRGALGRGGRGRAP